MKINPYNMHNPYKPIYKLTLMNDFVCQIDEVVNDDEILRC
jgi:hypothetical protein